jgi:hypothetical protein
MELFVNRHRVFFKVSRDIIFPDYDDDVLTPVSYDEALKLMEKYAQCKIPLYFSSLPEAGETITVITYRIPSFMHVQGKKMAKEKGVSFNAWLTNLVKTEIDTYLDERV